MGSAKSKKTAILFLTVILFITSMIPARAQGSNNKIDKLEFIDMPIIEILLALADIKNVSIITDETVHGNTTFTFVDIEIDEAFNLFLESHELYLTVKNGIYNVSKIKIIYDAEKNEVTMDANGVGLRLLIDAISSAIDKTIQYDPLPTLNPPVHANNMKVRDLLEMLLIRAPDYFLDVQPDYYYIKQTSPTPPPVADSKNIEDITSLEKQGDFYTINQKKKRFLDIIHDLFTLENKEYQMMMKRDVILEVLKFKNKRFEELLNLILEQANADYTVQNGIYKIFEIQQRDNLKDYLQVIHIPLQYLSPTDVQRIMPTDLNNSKFYRIDTNNNSIILSGSEKEIGPIRKFIASIDKPLGGSTYYRYDLNFVKAANIKSMLPNKYRQMEIITVPDTNSIIMLLTPSSKRYMDEFLGVLDKTIYAKEITLKYIKSEDLMKNLPPVVAREDVVVSGDPSIIFFKGTEEKLRVFREQLAIFDRPVPQIRYDVLVISFSEDENLNWRQNDGDEMNFNLFQQELNEDGELTLINDGTISFIGALSNVLSLNFNIPQIIGMTASLNLNLALSNSKAKVLTDTTLYGVSGRKVSFQDTEVFRYRTQEVDPDKVAGEDGGTITTTGPIQEITTGFTLNIEGWVSGEGMITMEVSVSSKKQGAAGDGPGSLGSTFDKVINTKVRIKSGQPFKIGGLIKQDKQEFISKIPFLGSIPIPGLRELFQRKKEEIRRSEIVIYILPHIEKAADELADVSSRVENLYTKFLVQPNPVR